MFSKSVALKNRLSSLMIENSTELENEIHSQLDQLKVEKLHWDKFMAKFNIIFPDFTKKLTSLYPEITNADIQFCALIRLNLNNKEIAGILNIEPRSIYKKRSRLMEKMKLQENDSIEKLLLEI